MATKKTKTKRAKTKTTRAKDAMEVEETAEVTMDTDPNPALSMEMKDAQSPSPLTLFLQCKDETKKYVLPKGSTGLTLERLHLAFIEKFEVDLPKIYIKDPASGVQYELEDPTDVEDRSLLILNEVKQHIEKSITSFDDDAQLIVEQWKSKHVKYKEIPRICELPTIADQPLQEGEKLPILSRDMESLCSPVFQHEDICRKSDISILFRTGAERPHISSEILTLIFRYPPPDGTESSFISFWDANIRWILEYLIPDGQSIRDSNQDTGIGNLRPDFGFLLENLCVFRGEEKPPGSRADPKQELSDKLEWAYDPAPYVLGYYATGSNATLVAISPPRSPGGSVIVHDISSANLRLKRDRILHIRRLINLSALFKAITGIANCKNQEFQKLKRENSNVEIAGRRIVKEFTCPDRYERLDRLCQIYHLLKEQKVPNTDHPVHMSKEKATVVLSPRGIERLPETEDELLSALKCVLECLQIIHKATLFHRDIRWPNVIKALGDNDNWFIIDWEDAACPPTKAMPHFNRKTHSPNIFLDGHGADVDIWGVGKLINSCKILHLSPEILDLGKYMQSADPPTAGQALERVMELRSSHSS